MHDKFIDALRTGRIEGRTRIILEDPATRRREIHEDKNMITNALQKIFNSNYLGMTDFYHMIPIRNLLGGVFLFWNNLTESADNIYPPDQNTNKLTGHAGQTTHSTASRTRGNPNGAASYVDAANGQVKFVWDFSLEQGNGKINAVSLTNPAAGDCGLYPDGSMPLVQAYGLNVDQVSRARYSTALGSTYNDEYIKRCPVSINNAGNGLSIKVSGNEFSEMEVRHPFVGSSLIEDVSFVDPDNYTVMNTRTATLSRSFTSNYTVVGQDSSNYYVMERDSSISTRLYLNIVSKSDMSVTAQTIDISGATLSRNQMTFTKKNNGIVSGGYIYWVSGSDAKTFVRINISTPADTNELTSYLTGNIDESMTPVVGAGGLILGKNYLINGDYVYPVSPRSARSNEYIINDSLAQYKNGPYIYQMSSGSPDLAAREAVTGGVLYLPYLASVNNLQSEITKSENRTMRVEYLLTLTGGN